MPKPNNRAIALKGANTNFNIVNIQSEALPTGGAQRRGRVTAAAKSLTVLRPEIVQAL